MHLRKERKRRKKRVNILVISLMMVGVMSFILLRYMNDKVNPFLLKYAEMEVKKITGIVVNGVVAKKLKSPDIRTEDLFRINRNQENEITMVDFNSILITSFMNDVTNEIYKELKSLELGELKKLTLPYTLFSDYNYKNLKRGIIYEMPITSYLGNTFLSNLGPRIPIRFTIVGNVSGYLETKIKPYGINNAMVYIYITLSLNELINLPFAYQKTTITTKLPISVKMIQGKVPIYYQHGLNQTSPILVNPVE